MQKLAHVSYFNFIMMFRKMKEIDLVAICKLKYRDTLKLLGIELANLPCWKRMWC